MVNSPSDNVRNIFVHLVGPSPSKAIALLDRIVAFTREKISTETHSPSGLGTFLSCRIWVKCRLSVSGRDDEEFFGWMRLTFPHPRVGPHLSVVAFRFPPPETPR